MAAKTQTGKGRPEPHTKPGHNGSYPHQPKKSTYSPTDKANAKKARV